MATSLNIWLNNTVNCGINQDRATVPGNYVQMDLAADLLLWTAGSARVADGQAKDPSSAELDEAATLIQVGAVEVDKCILNDDSSGFLDEIPGAGSTDDRYVFCLAFDAATATEPTLEAWDTNAHSTANNHVLGAGTPGNSMVKAVRTTAGTPGAGWAGTPIAGANTLQLNGGGGALGGATDVYVNIHLDIPGAYAVPFSETPVIVIRYTWS